MGRYIQFRDVEPGSPVWVERINNLLSEKKITQQELANQCGISPSVVSDWVGRNKRDNQKLREPKIQGFQKIAKFLGVSVDYLLGENECEIPEDEKIHEITGLSSIAIQKLKQANTKMGHGDISAEKQIFALNYLLESMSDVPLLENLYDYLLGEFSFPGKEESLGAAFMIERLPRGKQRRNLAFKDVFAQATFVNVQHDLMRLKDRAAEQRKSLEETSPTQQ